MTFGHVRPIFFLTILAACNSAVDLGANTDAGTSDASDAAPTCENVCARLQACGYVASDKTNACLAECRQKGRPEDLACAMREPCDTIPKVCGKSDGPTDAGSDGPSPLDAFEIARCQEGCDGAKFYSCIDAAAQSACRDLCTTAPASKRNAYASCANGSGGRCAEQVDCLNQFKK